MQYNKKMMNNQIKMVINIMETLQTTVVIIQVAQEAIVKINK